MKRLSYLVYATFGVGGILGGAVAVLAPGAVASSAEAGHLARELGAAGIFVGLMALWCIPNYERRRAVHYFLIVFFLLLALVHWLEYFTGHRSLVSPLANTVPLGVLLVLLGGLRKDSDVAPQLE